MLVRIAVCSVETELTPRLTVNCADAKSEYESFEYSASQADRRPYCSVRGADGRGIGEAMAMGQEEGDLTDSDFKCC